MELHTPTLILQTANCAGSARVFFSIHCLFFPLPRRVLHILLLLLLLWMGGKRLAAMD